MSEENINEINEVVDTSDTVTPVAETVNTEVQQAPVYTPEAPAGVLPGDVYGGYGADTGNTEPLGKKHKGLKIALIAIAAVVLILGIAFVILYTTNKEYVQNKWALLTKNDEDYFKWVVEKKTQNTKSAMLTRLDGLQVNEIPDTLTASGNLSISLSSELGQMVLGKSFTGIDNAGLRFEMAVENSNTAGVLVTPFYKNTDIISLGGAVDIAGKKAYITIPSYKPEVIGLEKLIEANKDKIDELKKQFEQADISSESISGMIQQFREYFNGDKLDELVNVILERTKDVELKKGENVHVGKLEGEFNVITGKISKTDVQNILKDYAGKILDASYDSLADMAKNDPSMGNISKDSLKNVKDSIDKAIEKLTATVDVKAYVDNKGNIAGGSLKVTVGRYPLAISWLTLPDEKDDTGSVFAADIQFEGFVIATITNDIVKTDSLVSNNISIKPGAFVASAAEAVAPGIGNYSISIITKSEKKDADTEDSSFSISVLNKTDAMASIVIDCNITYGKANMPVDISTSKVIDIYDVPDSDYIDATLFGRLLLMKLDEINDPGLNNFIDRALKSSGMSIEELRTLIDSGAADAANNSIKKALRKALGLPEPYNYASAAEAPKEENGKLVYSWDVLKDTDVSYDNLSFEVYDHFKKPEIIEPDVETEKKTLLLQYADETYSYAAGPSDVIEKGDKITFDAALVVFGKAVDSYSYSDNTAVIGRYEYGAGIDDKLLGMKAGDSKDIELTLDERYGSFAGFTGTFRITVTKIEKTFGPEWSERFIVDKLGYESLEACEAYLAEEAKKKLPEPEPEPGVCDIKSALLDMAIYKNTYTITDEEIKNNLTAYYGAAESGGTYFLQELYGANNPQRNQDEKNRIVSPTSDYKSNRAAFCASVAYKTGISFSKEELEAYYENLAKEFNYASGTELMDKIKKYYGERFLVDFAIERKVSDLLYEIYRKKSEFGLV